MAQDIGHQIADDLRSGKNAEALQLIGDALRASPRDPRLWTLDGIAHAQAGERGAALQSFRQALQYAPDYVPALESAARMEYEARDPAASVHLKKLEQLRPEEPEVHRMLAGIDFEHGDCAAARDELASDAATAQREFGACLVNQKRFAEAAPVFKRIAKEDPGNAKATYDAAVAEFLARRYEDVIARLGPQAVSLNADALELLGESYAASGRPDAAVKVFARAIVLDPSNAMHYVRFANACLPIKQFTAALEALNAGIKAHPSFAPLFVSRGITYAELGRYDDAATDLQTAQSLDPAEAAGAIGLTELQRGDPARTEADARESLRQHPNDPMLHYVLAETIVRNGAPPGSREFDEAVSAARMAVQENPNLSVAHDVLGRLYLQEGRTEDAITESRTALRGNPRDATALYHMILTLRRTGQTAEVPGLLRRLAQIRAQSPSNGDQGRMLVDKAPAVRAR